MVAGEREAEQGALKCGACIPEQGFGEILV
jgi:hypothetical protein